MSGGTAHLLMALFMAAAAAMGYPSRRSATDLDATPRMTVTFDGKGVQVMVVAVRFGILPAPGLVHRDCVQPSPAPRSRGLSMAVWLQGGLRSPGLQKSEPAWLSGVGCLELMCPEGWSRAKASPQKPGGDKDVQGASPWPCLAALGG